MIRKSSFGDSKILFFYDVKRSAGLDKIVSYGFSILYFILSLFFSLFIHLLKVFIFYLCSSFCFLFFCLNQLPVGCVVLFKLGVRRAVDDLALAAGGTSGAS